MQKDPDVQKEYPHTEPTSSGPPIRIVSATGFHRTFMMLSGKRKSGNGRYVFPSERTKQRPMSNNTVLAALRRMGFSKEEMSGHGFRAMARTMLDEVLNVRPDFIEHQLAHEVKDPNGRAYNRTSFLDERRNMMQTWADYLDGLKTGAKVIPLKKKA